MNSTSAALADIAMQMGSGTGMNILLIGFTSCGKSTVGRQLAQLTTMEFVDTDFLVEEAFYKEHGIRFTCREIYRQHGAATMRGLESQVLREVAQRNNLVIATGGGIVLHPDNRPLLQQAGLCFFLDTPLPLLEQRLEKHLSSPLFAEKTVAQLHGERYPHYKECGHITYEPREGESPHSIAMHLIRLREETMNG